MGMLSNGTWQIENPPNQKGAFVRPESTFRGMIDLTDLQASHDRFALIVSKACPWAHRTLIFRKLKGLESLIDVAYVKPHMAENGWEFCEPLGEQGFKYLHEFYASSQADFTGKVTVPVLWDKLTGQIINNESSDIIDMLNSKWNSVAKFPDVNLRPKEKLLEITEHNDWIYENINNAVYRTGFATEQAVYEKECQALFDAIMALETQLLDGRDYLLGEKMYGCDIRLFTTLIRFDAVYYGHFKCNLRQIADYPKLTTYLERIYKQVSDTVDFDEIKQHYYMSHPWINPNQIVPVGPDLDFNGE